MAQLSISAAAARRLVMIWCWYTWEDFLEQSTNPVIWEVRGQFMHLWRTLPLPRKRVTDNGFEILLPAWWDIFRGDIVEM